MTQDTIAAVSTAPGVGGIAVIRVSGPQAIETVDTAWHGKPLSQAATHTVHLGKYVATDGTLLDEAVATVFRAPHTFTGEDVVEISVHGSRWIQREVLADLIRRGARTAGPGEFTQRAFLNGRVDLAQAEGIADLIAASSKAAHDLAINQTRGNFSRELDALRERLVEFASLLELELDFSEEDVEFADRSRLLELADRILSKVDRLASSYSSGAALKEGIPVVIAGVPNAGKSSLLNLLLGDDKAIVSDIPGTTRDVIEDTLELDGILYRFIDTAGLRESADTVEAIGIDRARAKIRDARIVIWLLDPTSDFALQENELSGFINSAPDSKIVLLVNKSDLCQGKDKASENSFPEINQLTTKFPDLKPIRFSTKNGEGLTELQAGLNELATDGYDPQAELMVTNARHYEALLRGSESLRRAVDGINSGLSADFIAQDVREALEHLGTITGAISSDTLLHSIFSRFCIGK